jgi:hypothetical protein
MEFPIYLNLLIFLTGNMTFSLSQSTSQADSKTIKIMNIPDNANDFNQWLNAMKMVARLPGGMPPEFRRKVQGLKQLTEKEYNI